MVTQLRILPENPPVGGGFPTSGTQIKIEGPYPFVMLWAVRFDYLNDGNASNRFMEVTFGNQSADEQQRWWRHKIQAPASAGGSGTVLMHVGGGVSTVTPGAEGVMQSPLAKVPLPSGASFFIAGPNQVGDQLSNIQIVAYSGELLELLQM